MCAYNNIDRALLGLKADNNKLTRVGSYAAGEDIGFGYPVFGYLGAETDQEQKAWLYHNDTAKIVWDADFVTSNVVTVTVNGEEATTTFDTDQKTTMNNLLAAVTALSGVDAALDPDDVDKRTLYVRTVGTDAIVTESVTAGVSQARGMITTSSDQVFLGVAMFVQKDTRTANDSKFYKNQPVSIMEEGTIWSIIDSAANSLAVAYIETTDGKFSLTAGETVDCLFKTDTYTDATTSDVMAIVEVRGAKKLNNVIAWS